MDDMKGTRLLLVGWVGGWVVCLVCSVCLVCFALFWFGLVWFWFNLVWFGCLVVCCCCCCCFYLLSSICFFHSMIPMIFPSDLHHITWNWPPSSSLPSWELTCPHPKALLSLWLSFSPGGICYFPGGYPSPFLFPSSQWPFHRMGRSTTELCEIRLLQWFHDTLIKCNGFCHQISCSSASINRI